MSCASDALPTKCRVNGWKGGGGTQATSCCDCLLKLPGAQMVEERMNGVRVEIMDVAVFAHCTCSVLKILLCFATQTKQMSRKAVSGTLLNLCQEELRQLWALSDIVWASNIQVWEVLLQAKPGLNFLYVAMTPCWCGFTAPEQSTVDFMQSSCKTVITLEPLNK